MKLGLIFVLCLFSRFSLATEIVSAKFNSDNQLLTLELAFTGGNQEHKFSLLWDQCQIRNGVNEIAARLVDVGHDDAGREELLQTLEIDLSNLSCKPAWLTIRSGRFSHKTLWIN